MDKLQAFADGLAALQLEDDTMLVFREHADSLTIPVAGIVYAVPDKRGVRIALAGGQEVLTRPSENLATVGARLAAHPNFVQTANSWLVNLDYVSRIKRTSSVVHELLFAAGGRAPLTMNLDQVMAYFGIDNLDHVTPWSDREAAIVAEGLRMFEKDIRFMDDDVIRANFSAASTGELVLRRLIGNLLWQAYNRIQEGQLAPIDGNIRSLWYSHMKPVLGRFWDLNHNEYGDKLYKYLIDIFSDYVGELHLFRYKDFGLVDESGGLWQVGERHPAIIVSAEKTGQWRLLQTVAAETGVTVISLGGQPSLMTTEALIDQLVAKGVGLEGEFRLITDVDYDPSGNLIAKGFIKQLRQMALSGTVDRFDVIQPENFTLDEIKFMRYHVANQPGSSATKVKAWMDKTVEPFGGGLPGPDGKPVTDGLESDSMPPDRRRDLIVNAITCILQAPAGEPWAQTVARIKQNRPPLHSVWDGYEARWKVK